MCVCVFVSSSTCIYLYIYIFPKLYPLFLKSNKSIAFRKPHYYAIVFFSSYTSCTSNLKFFFSSSLFFYSYQNGPTIHQNRKQSSLSLSDIFHRTFFWMDSRKIFTPVFIDKKKYLFVVVVFLFQYCCSPVSNVAFENVYILLTTHTKLKICA